MKTFPKTTLADLLERDIGTVGRALRTVKPDATEKGISRWKIVTALKALGALPGSNGAAPSRRAEVNNSPTFADERTRLMRAKANVAERHDRAADGELVNVKKLVMLHNVERSVVREKLLSLAGEVQGDIGAEGAALVDMKCREALLELSDANSLMRRAARVEAGLGDLHDAAVAARKKDDDEDD